MGLSTPYLDDGDVKALPVTSWRDALRFLSLVERVGDCWIWQGAKGGNGYGHFRIDGELRPAHRVAYEAFVGPVPEGLQMDHLCRVRACVNPLHVEPVTASENCRRGWANRHHRPPTCPQGHEFTTDNTYRDPKNGWRHCRACLAARARRRRRMAHAPS